MTLSEFQQKIDRALNRIDSELETQVAVAGNDLVALITNRVVQRGETADGGSFTPYSTTEVPAFFYFNRGRTSSANSTAKQKAKKHEEISYKEWRGLNNLNTSPKNYEFTGEMWRGFGVKSIQRTANGATITIGGTTNTSEDRITWNSKQEGKSIIKPSKKEIEIVTANLNKWLNNVINGGSNKS